MQTVVTSLHVKFLIVNLFIFIHLILFIEHGGLKKKVFSQGGDILAYNKIFSAF